jgi:hypothetical protein
VNAVYHLPYSFLGFQVKNEFLCVRNTMNVASKCTFT